jgi:hypothetical protein
MYANRLGACGALAPWVDAMEVLDEDVDGDVRGGADGDPKEYWGSW